MKLFLFHLNGLLFCLRYTWANAYHYDQPQIPFTTQSKFVASEKPQYITHSLGPTGKTYEVEMSKSQEIFFAQTGAQQQYHHAYSSLPSALNLRQPHQQRYSTNSNHFISPYQTKVASPPSKYFTPLSALTEQQTTSITLQQPNKPGSADPQLPAVLPVSSASLSFTNFEGQKASSAAPQLQDNSAKNNNQPYNTVQLENGQRIQDGGHGNGGQYEASSRPGDYHSQSQSSQLDYYTYKQSQPGDKRDFLRFHTTCQPNGNCQGVSLGPGQAEPRHQQNVFDLRAHSGPSRDDCRQYLENRSTKEAAGGCANMPQATEIISQGQVRPRDRRYYPYTETIISRDPYN